VQKREVGNSIAETERRIRLVDSEIQEFVDGAGSEIVAEMTNAGAADTFDTGDGVVLNWAREDTQLARA
jgi:hypothetical protein